MSCSNNNSTSLPVIVGADGADGRGIVSVIRTTGTGAPGATDIYTITYTDSTTSTFTVYNGADGADGTNGAPIIYNDFSGTAKTGAYQSLNDYLLPINQLTQAGDMVKVDAYITHSTGAPAHLKVKINGGDGMPSIASLPYMYINEYAVLAKISFSITRLTATTVFISYSLYDYFAAPFGPAYYTEFIESSISVSNLTALTNLIDIQGSTDSTNTLTCNQMVVTYYKKQ
jgi:hypothetical protein